MQAKTPEDAARGLIFIQEMVELSKHTNLDGITQLQAVYYIDEDKNYEILKAGPSHFSPELTDEKSIKEKAVFAIPYRLCSGGLSTCDNLPEQCVLINLHFRPGKYRNR